MPRFLQNLAIDRVSFWIGFVAGGLFLWFLSKLKILLPRTRRFIKERIQASRQGITVNTEHRFRNDTVRMAQRMHLAAPLFALDEVLVVPHILAPPSQIQPGENNPEDYDYSYDLPYLPDWPELAATYNAPVLTLLEVFQGGCNLALLGHPGSGKTVALAYLATIVSRNEPEAGVLTNLLPILVHVADLDLQQQTPDDPLEALINAAAEHVSTLTLPGLSKLIHNAFESGNALLLVDGLDELVPNLINQTVAYLGVLLQGYPGNRMIVAAPFEYYDGLSHLGLTPIALAAWNQEQRSAFIKHWGEIWTQYIVHRVQGEPDEADPMLLNGWLVNPETSSTPLDITLKVWAAYAGDSIGPSRPDAIESYLLRMTADIEKARPVMEKLASQMVFTMTPIVNYRDAERWVPEFEPSVSPFDQSEILTGATDSTVSQPESPSEQSDQSPPTIQTVEPAEQLKQPVVQLEQSTSPTELTASQIGIAVTTEEIQIPPEISPSKEVSTIHRVLPSLVSNGLLIPCIHSRLRFVNPIIAGYLAGTALASSGEIESLYNKPEWAGKSLTMHYVASWNDLSTLVTPMLGDTNDPLQRKLLTAGRWLRDASKSAKWRTAAMRQLANTLKGEKSIQGLQARALTALISSDDSGVAYLLKQLLSSSQANTRRLAALGYGMMRDPKLVNELIELINDPAPQVRQSALLALVTIGTKPALEAVADTLLHGSEEARSMAAEALANHPEEGYPALEEGSKMEDISVRRAVVFGLAKVDQPWAIRLLEKIQVEDEQWVVRSAAANVLEEKKRLNPHIPHPLLPLPETPWVIAFAGKLGLGVAPGKPAMNLLLQTFTAGDKNERQAALEYISQRGDADSLPYLYQLLNGDDQLLREAAYSTLWYLAASGVSLPPPNPS